MQRNKYHIKIKSIKNYKNNEKIVLNMYIVHLLLDTHIL